MALPVLSAATVAMCPATVLSGVVYISPQLWGKRERIEEREAEMGMGEGERVEEREAGMGMGGGF